MKGLILHCGGALKTREEVFAVEPPAATDSYVPLPYESFLTRIEKQLAVEEIKIKDERLALAFNGQRLFGLIEVEFPKFAHAEYGCVLGFRNSYDKSCSTGICIGATVFVCDNLSFQGSDVTFHRKHTANLMRDLSWVITETVATLPKRFAAQSAVFERYKQKEISDPQAHDLIIRMFDAGAVHMSDVPDLLQEWREPRHPEFATNGKSLWRLFNAATEVLKGDVWRLPGRTRTIHGLFDTECAKDTGEELCIDA